MGSGLGRALSTLTSAPWRRAPILLRRRPGVLVTVAAACAVMTTSLAAVPLFLSSVGTESVALQASERCPRDTGVSLHFAPTPSAVTSPPADPLTPLRGELGPTNRWARIGGAFAAGADPAVVERASLLTRDGAHDHVDVLETAPGPGVWVSDRATELLGLHAGDVARIGDREVPVTGVYRDISGNTVDDFWCSNADMVLIEARGGDLVPPAAPVPGRSRDLRVAGRRLRGRAADGAWDAPLGDGLTMTEADALVADARLRARRRRGAPVVRRRTAAAPARRGRGSRRYLRRGSRRRRLRRALPALAPSVRHRALPGDPDLGRRRHLADRRVRGPRRGRARGRRPPRSGSTAGGGRSRCSPSAGCRPPGLGFKAVLELVDPAGRRRRGWAWSPRTPWSSALGPSPVLEPSALRDAAVRSARLALVGAAAHDRHGRRVAGCDRHARHAARRRWFAGAAVGAPPRVAHGRVLPAAGRLGRADRPRRRRQPRRPVWG